MTADDGHSLFLPGGPRGALLLHGFTGTPHEMGYLAEHLHRAGMTVVAPLLAGHGSTTEVLEGTGWTDWLASAEAGLTELRRSCSVVQVAGFSMGGALALLLAARHPDAISALALMSTPLWLPFYFRWPLRLLARAGLDRRLRAAPRLTRGDVRDRDQRRANVVTPAYPLRATHSMLELVEAARARIEEVRCPALVLHARRDHTVPYACSTELARRLRARRVTLRRSFHVIPIDVEREQVAREVESFFRAHPEEGPHVS